MKKIIFIICITFLYTASISSQNDGKWVSLFNGKDLTNWTRENPGGFEVVKRELITSSFDSSKIGNDIFTNKLYGNFILRLEFLLSEGGNSGVYIRCKPPFDKHSGFEVQILAPWTPWRDDLHCTGSIYGHVAVTNRPDETTGVWYKMEIKCDRNIITISVNDKVATMANIDTVKTMVNKPFFGVIGLQNYANNTGHYAKFRNIYIRELDVEPDYIIKGFYEKNVQLRDLAHVAAVNLGAEMVPLLADSMSGDSTVAKNGAKQALFDVVAKASDPKTSKKEKKEVTVALKKCINNTSSEITKNYLKWLLGMIIN